jgi:hypothetical protein
MWHSERSKSMHDLASEVSMSASRKSDQETSCSGASTRPVVRAKSSRLPRASTLAGSSSSSASAV